MHYRVGPMRPEAADALDEMVNAFTEAWDLDCKPEHQMKAAIGAFLKEAGLADKADRIRFENNAVDACMMLHEIAQEERMAPPDEDRPYPEHED